MPTVFEVADDYAETFARLDPVSATDYGIRGHDDEMTDYCPDAADARAEADLRALAALDAAEVRDDGDRVAADVMRERIGVPLAQHDMGELLRDLRVIGSLVQGVRQCFDLMAYDTDDD